MSKNVGNYLQFWFGGREYPVEGVEYSSDYSELDTTDTSSPADATETVLNRTKRALKVDGTLAAAMGAEVATGTAVLGTTYLVTKGTITEAPSTYLLGTIFTSAGTGVLTTDNRVKPLGAKLLGKDIECNWNVGDVPVTAIKYSEEYSEYDATDSSTTGDATEWITGRAKRTGTLELIQTNTAADLLTTDPVADDLVLTFGAGLTLTGKAILKKLSVVTSGKGDMVKVTYECNWVGSVVSTLADVLTPAVSTAVIVIWKTGVSTNKQISGNAVVVSTSIEADINSLVKVSYGLDFVGAVTPAVAN